MSFSASPSAPGNVAGGPFGGVSGRSGRPEPGDHLPYRARELTLLIFAGVLATAALAAVVIAHDDKITTAVFGYGFGFFALWGAAHLAVRILAPAADPLLLPLAAALNGLGLVMIYRIDLDETDKLAKNQIVWTFVAILVFVAVLVFVRDHRALARYTYTAGLAGLFFLALPAVPGVGRSVNGARLWVYLGPLHFQPSEIAKIILMIFFAGYLVSKKEVLSLVSRTFLGLPLPRARDLGPILLAWLASIGVLVLETDFGSSLLFFGMFLTILYVATERVSWVVIGLLLFVGGAYFSYLTVGHVQARVSLWLHPFTGVKLHGPNQLVQGLYGFGAGGITGTGLGHGHPYYVFAARSDFVMASIGEELGLIGVTAVLLMYALIVTRGLRAALGVRDPFGKLLATGLSFSLALQVFVQVGGVMRLIPLTGITLPFVSSGGSSVVANAAIIALLLRISDSYREPVTPVPAAPLFDPAAVADSPTQVVRKS